MMFAITLGGVFVKSELIALSDEDSIIVLSEN